MTKKNITKRSLMLSGLSLLICISMLIGSTFAWFTDSVSSMRNVITAGNLDIELLANGQPVDQTTKLFDEVEFWEPGVVVYENLQVVNKGALALKYEMQMIFGGENDFNGHKLSEVLQIAVIDKVEAGVDRESVVAAAKASDTCGSLNDFFMSGMLEANTAGAEKGVVIFWEPQGADIDNLYNVNNGQSTSDGEPLRIEFGVNLRATQAVSESDSFGNDYDKDATLPTMNMDVTVSKTLKTSDVENGVLTRDLTLANADGSVSAEIPAGVKIALGARALTMTITSIKDSEAGITANNRSEVVHSVDVHIDGIAEDNTVPMIIAIDQLFPAGLNDNNLDLYHVEDGQTIEMTLVDVPANHNEFSYDPMNGNAAIAIASFSEIVVYGDTKVDWDGKTIATNFGAGTGTEADPYIIANGEQLAYFRNAVDDGNTFEGKFIKLNANINLADYNFDPIGWGYEHDDFTANGKTFNGTFDGGNHIIFGLYQNGWEANDCGKTYSYDMAGGGLFASVCDATIKNLTISGADIVMECIDMGVLAGYAQGNCTFDNIAIINCTIQNYNRYTGGVVGECSPRYDENGTPLHSNHVFNNIRVDSTTTISSLWGSFDTSLGGILGGKWDKNGAETKVTMTNCDVACTIDAFNDVTSAYQWYAYRRAGMLIGNTEQSQNTKALANFLTCENVHVYYGEWNNYHYCEFTNQSGGENTAWQNNYPWVRVESGLSCNAYSNPRYGHPIVNGTAIVDSVHSHAGDDECMISLPFEQLYGGGQGVYGATKHDGVSEGAYTVTYINYDETIRVEFVGDNSQAHILWDTEGYFYGNSKAIAWVDGNGKEVSSIAAGNKKNYVVYPKFAGEFAIRFFDAEGNVVYYETFKERNDHTLNTAAIEAVRADIQKRVDASGKVIIVSWDRTNLNTISKSEATKDIVVKAVYTLSTSSITLTPVEGSSGNIVSYKVTDANKTVENVLIDIPAYVGTIPVTQISNNAFAGFDNLHVVTIPTTITVLGENSFASDWGLFDSGESMTLYYEGSYQNWLDNMTFADGWSDGLSASTRVFFLNGTDTVDKTQGYLQFTVKSSLFGKTCNFEHVATVPDNFYSDYYKECDCSVNGCKGNLRPDAIYWEGLNN